jgi:hypothetical protein
VRLLFKHGGWDRHDLGNGWSPIDNLWLWQFRITGDTAQMRRRSLRSCKEIVGVTHPCFEHVNEHVAMKTNLTNSLCTLCAILLIAVLILQLKQQGHLDELQRQQDAFTSATAQRQQEARNEVAKLADHLTSFGTNLKSLLTRSEEQQNNQRVEMETHFRGMGLQLDDLVSSGALFPNKSKPAGEAVTLAMAAEKAGDTNLAKIYYLSAINHAPSEFSMLNNYAELVFRDSSATTEDFDRLKSVLQISLYQVPPATVTNALDLLNQTVRREEQLLAIQTPKPVPVNWQERFEQLTNSNTLENSWADLKQISLRWDGLSEIVESFHEEQPASELTRQVEQELELTQRVLAATRLAGALDTMMNALDSSSEQPEKAVSLLQSAEAMLGQLWGINSAGWPAALRSKIDQYPKDIQNRVETVAEFKSRPFLAKVESERDSAKSYVEESFWKSLVAKGHPCQRVVANCDGCYERAVAAAQNISSAQGRKKAEAAMKDIRDIVIDAKRKQFDAYQKRVVVICKTGFDEHNKVSDWYKLGALTTSTARGVFKRSGLVTVDQSLLAPETARLFNDVLGKITGHMDGDGQFATQKEIADENPKLKLEDF